MKNSLFKRAVAAVATVPLALTQCLGVAQAVYVDESAVTVSAAKSNDEPKILYIEPTGNEIAYYEGVKGADGVAMAYYQDSPWNATVYNALIKVANDEGARKGDVDPKTAFKDYFEKIGSSKATAQAVSECLSDAEYTVLRNGDIVIRATLDDVTPILKQVKDHTIGLALVKLAEQYGIPELADTDGIFGGIVCGGQFTGTIKGSELADGTTSSMSMQVKDKATGKVYTGANIADWVEIQVGIVEQTAVDYCKQFEDQGLDLADASKKLSDSLGYFKTKVKYSNELAKKSLNLSRPNGDQQFYHADSTAVAIDQAYEIIDNSDIMQRYIAEMRRAAKIANMNALDREIPRYSSVSEFCSKSQVLKIYNKVVSMAESTEAGQLFDYNTSAEYIGAFIDEKAYDINWYVRDGIVFASAKIPDIDKEAAMAAVSNKFGVNATDSYKQIEVTFDVNEMYSDAANALADVQYKRIVVVEPVVTTTTTSTTTSTTTTTTTTVSDGGDDKGTTTTTTVSNGGDDKGTTTTTTVSDGGDDKGTTTTTTVSNGGDDKGTTTTTTVSDGGDDKGTTTTTTVSDGGDDKGTTTTTTVSDGGDNKGTTTTTTVSNGGDDKGTTTTTTVSDGGDDKGTTTTTTVSNGGDNKGTTTTTTVSDGGDDKGTTTTTTVSDGGDDKGTTTTTTVSDGGDDKGTTTTTTLSNGGDDVTTTTTITTTGENGGVTTTRAVVSTVVNIHLNSDPGFYLNIDKEFTTKQVKTLTYSVDRSVVYLDADDNIVGQTVRRTISEGDLAGIFEYRDTPSSVYGKVLEDGNFQFIHNIQLYATSDIVDEATGMTIVTKGTPITYYNGAAVGVTAYVGVKGDADFDGIADATDATTVLTWYAIASTSGSDAEALENTQFSTNDTVVAIDPMLDHFAAFLCDVDNENNPDNWSLMKTARRIDASDASFIMVTYAELSTTDVSKVDFRDLWNETLGEEWAKK